MTERIVLVSGTGCSGTSTVARLLHEDLGISMGEMGGKGNYECLVFNSANREVVNDSRSYESWHALVVNAVKQKQHEKVWGFKSAWLCWLLHDYIQVFAQWCGSVRVTLLVAERPISLCHASARRRFGYTFAGKKGIRDFVLRRAALDQQIHDVTARGKALPYVRFEAHYIPFGLIKSPDSMVREQILAALYGENGPERDQEVE